jgi:hypothetical protein
LPARHRERSTRKDALERSELCGRRLRLRALGGFGQPERVRDHDGGSAGCE